MKRFISISLLFILACQSLIRWACLPILKSTATLISGSFDFAKANLNQAKLSPMKQSLDLSRKCFEILFADPGLLKKVAARISLFILTIMLFGIIVRSLPTAKFFADANL